MGAAAARCGGRPSAPITPAAAGRSITPAGLLLAAPPPSFTSWLLAQPGLAPSTKATPPPCCQCCRPRPARESHAQNKPSQTDQALFELEDVNVMHDYELQNIDALLDAGGCQGPRGGWGSGFRIWRARARAAHKGGPAGAPLGPVVITGGFGFRRAGFPMIVRGSGRRLWFQDVQAHDSARPFPLARPPARAPVCKQATPPPMSCARRPSAAPRCARRWRPTPPRRRRCGRTSRRTRRRGGR